jgi:hypothetical protein
MSTSKENRCENCGSTLRSGICTNCQEELYIYQHQMEPEDRRKMSKEFSDKVEQQIQSQP